MRQCVTHLTISCMLSLWLVSCAPGRQAFAVPEPGPGVVTACQLMQDQGAYAGREIVLEGIWTFWEHGTLLFDGDCIADGTERVIEMKLWASTPGVDMFTAKAMPLMTKNGGVFLRVRGRLKLHAQPFDGSPSTFGVDEFLSVTEVRFRP